MEIMNMTEVAQKFRSRKGGTVSAETVRRYCTSGVRVGEKKIYLKASHTFPSGRGFTQADIDAFQHELAQARGQQQATGGAEDFLRREGVLS